MRYIDPAIKKAFKAKLKSFNQTICFCYEFTLNNGTIVGITDLDKDITVNGNLYSSAPGISLTNIVENSDFSPSNLEMVIPVSFAPPGNYDPQGQNEDEGDRSGGDEEESDFTLNRLRSGIYSKAKIQIFLVDYEDTTLFFSFKRGTVGNIITKNLECVIEFRGVEQILKQNIVEVTSRYCRATLGDNRCKVDLSTFTNSGRIANHTGKTLVITFELDEHYLANGYIEITNGPYIGARYDVETNSGSTILLLDEPEINLTGFNLDTVSGCDKTVNQCFTKFNNILNNRSEPHIPTRDKIITGKEAKTGSVTQSTSGGSK